MAFATDGCDTAAALRAELDMDRRERNRLKDEINRGTLNVGITRVEEGAYEKESRLPLVKGGTIGFGLGGALGLFYLQNNGLFNRSPLGLFSDDYVLVGFGIIAGGTAVGAALGWLAGTATSARGKPPKDTP
jgi:hypothetical protein